MVVFYKMFEDMFINIRHICALQENSKKLFVNNFGVPELFLLTQEETMVKKISAA